VFNFSTEVEFPQSGHRVVIEHRLLGVDVFNSLRMVVSVTGDVPSITSGAKIDLPDFDEEYIKTDLGRFQSTSRRVLRVEGIRTAFFSLLFFSLTTTTTTKTTLSK